MLITDVEVAAPHPTQDSSASDPIDSNRALISFRTEGIVFFQKVVGSGWI